jgi:hypothetical protein
MDGDIIKNILQTRLQTKWHIGIELNKNLYTSFFIHDSRVFLHIYKKMNVHVRA